MTGPRLTADDVRSAFSQFKSTTTGGAFMWDIAVSNEQIMHLTNTLNEKLDQKEKQQ
ncbi:hypothetical protein [Streptomyces sp. WAC07149]|uniref:hypothetical protein n=1 Tax=Streptomyces sp. WAC07149 TaxID=2487425 RepID=UPI00163B92F9|nr:hypothetical protein [Streptomyces sp. WAC07149]